MVCRKCGKITRSLYDINEEMFCESCYFEITGIEPNPLSALGFVIGPNTEFQLNVFKGNIAESIIQCLFQLNSYIVFPFGYENYKTSLINLCPHPSNDSTIRLIRASPDLFVYDREENTGNLVEIKASTVDNENDFCIDWEDFYHYYSHWPETILTVYCMKKNRIYCKRMNEFDLNSIQRNNQECRFPNAIKLNLIDTFYPISFYFNKVTERKIPFQLREILFSLGQFRTN